VLSLGRLPLVNELVEPGDTAAPAFPLDVVRCCRCTLVQLRETVSPETLFRTYPYLSSYSDTFVEHARAFAAQATNELDLADGSLVIEAASNDGYLLQFFKERGIGALGIEPARNVAAVARQRGIDTIAEFLDARLARNVVTEHGTAALVVANNVVAHVPELRDFVAALAVLAGPDGRVVIEVPYVRDLVDRVEFDTIYHEHVSYFSLTSLRPVLEENGLNVIRVERISVHGGSLRVHASSKGRAEASVAALLAEEAAWGIDDAGRFERFADAVSAVRSEVHDFVARLVSSGARVAAYGAAAKGVVLANTCALDRELVAFVVDRNEHKQGKQLPGVGIPIRKPEALHAEQPDYCLLFAWNLAAEIARQQSAYLAAGGKFITPVPAPKVLAA
jgi:SAM-dependent methyltransferase